MNGSREIRRWYEITTRTYAENADCAIGGGGPWEVQIPDDIGWTRIAVCSLDDDRAEIDIGQ